MINFLKKFKKIKRYIQEFLVIFGFRFPKKTEDRYFLEKFIFDYLNSRRKLLFIGVDIYTKHYYDQLYFDVYTIDINPKKKRYGNKSKHITDSAERLSKIYKSKFDVVIANGLIGFGVNKLSQFKKVLNEIYSILNENGILILGFNDTSELLFFDMPKNNFYDKFSEFIPNNEMLNKSRMMVDNINKHTFIFLKKI